MTTAPTLLWFRRDLRLRDHPALDAAAQQGPVTALFVLDQVLLAADAGPRTAYLYRTLRALDEDLRSHGGRLTVRRGRPANVVPHLAKEIGASAVHVSEDFAPYGTARDARVERSLGDVPLVRTGSPYAVSPGQVRKQDGGPFKVFTPFYRAWSDRGWHSPSRSSPSLVDWHPVDGIDIPHDPVTSVELPDAGEAAAHKRWEAFLCNDIDGYKNDRDRPDLDSSSHLSPHLKFGTIHPRTMLADLGKDGEAYRRQLCWREFYAAVLHHWPSSAHEYFLPAMKQMRYDTGKRADDRFAAWQRGVTGYPIVDAGMRQLSATGWMHNRVRLIVASFLVKDLHLEWTLGAKHFMDHLIDGDLANNQHGWQWAAGTGTDAAPYFRIFNPVTQAKKFDPDGDYVRRWVPELKSLSAKQIHEPWALDEPPEDYPGRIVDHDTERKESLARYQAIR
ncbi:deoxyribodipyrimidine photo-lyase [Lapillicoccus sp.]|uniref:cryptochrome/photolyase family protein n=1 Tax=Lapillicoccus sp. TaxID=1909287 RepID=UPI00326499B4